MSKLEKLNHYYQIHVNHLLSTRLDTDISKEFFDKMVFHGTAYNSLQTIVDSFEVSNQSTFTLTGSYGTGKSTLATVLLGLLHENVQIRESARHLISDKNLLRKIDKSFKTKKPWLVIKAVGGVASPVDLFQKAILKAIKEAGFLEYFESNLFFSVEEIKDDKHLIDWVSEVFTILQGKISGVIFVLDEMGKLLDNIARNSGDLHIFQELSEKINRLSTKKCPFIFLGILHQAFSDYAKGLSHQVALEWAKIQGRYVDIAYRISLDESVALIAKTIRTTHHKIPENIVIQNNKIIDDTTSSISSRLIESSPNIKEYFKGALPLHPLTTTLLGSISKSSFSQNERSIFSFLLSVEPLSFRRFLEEDIENYRTYTIVDLWDYLSQNLQHQIAGSKEGHSWGVIEEALTLLSKQLNKLEANDLDELYFNIIKAIAMINLFGKPLGIYPTEKLILNALPTRSHNSEFIDQCLENLKLWGLITYWNRTDSYEVVETSEINVQQLLNEKIQVLSNEQDYFEHIDYKGTAVLAKRHYQQKGVMRWMSQHLVNDLAGLKRLYNSESFKETKAFAHFVLIKDYSFSSSKLKELSNEYQGVVVSQLRKLNEIVSWSKEIYALKEILLEQPKLMIDPVAKKEYEQRLNYAYQQIDILFQQSFDNIDWYFAGKKIEPKSLSTVASEIADQLFYACPSVSNELVVRQNVSSSAASGRRKLLEKMLESSHKENLGIDKFPPEKAIYLSCLKQLGLHQYQPVDDIWAFVIPDVNTTDISIENSKLVAQMFETGYTVFKKNTRLVTLAELYEEWSKPPFGIPQGLLPILSVALLLSKENALAFYDKDITQEFRFISSMDSEFLNKVIKRPHEVAVKFVKEPAQKNRFIEILSKHINEIFDKKIDSAPLPVARFIVSYLMKQSNWVKFSKDIEFFSKKVQKIRSFIIKADDPYKLLFEDIYDFLDVENRTDKQIEADIADFFTSIGTSKISLYQNFEKQIHKELGNITSDVLDQAKSISQSAADWQMKKFAEHLSKSSSDSSQWISNMITLLGQIPERDWTDDTLKKSFENLSAYVHRFKQLSFFVQNNNPTPSTIQNQQSLAIIVNTKQGFEEYNRDVVIDHELQSQLVDLKVELDHRINAQNLNDDTKALLLYELLKQYLYPVNSGEKYEK